MNRDLGIRLPTLVAADPGQHVEKRVHPRYQLGVRCWMADGRNTLYARVHDVSAGGLSVRAPVPFAPDAELELTLVLPSSDGRDPAIAVRALGRVVWVRAREGGARMGAEFLHIESGASSLASIFG